MLRNSKTPSRSIKKQLIIAVSLILCLGFQASYAQNDEDIIIGKKFNLFSKILDENRQCLISFPESYNESNSTAKYPLLILLDGSTHFQTTAGIVHFMSSARNRNKLIPEMIIVAIENVDRERDFTVTKIKTERINTMGGGKDFLAFIEKELIPYMDKNYHTENQRILVGHSLGGLLALNSYIYENSLFNAYLSIDPSVWWDDQKMIEKVDSIGPSSFNKKIYIATANQGSAKQGKNKKRHDALYSLMKKRNEYIQVKIEYFENEDHRSVPLKAIYEGLKYLYDDEM